MNEDPILRQSIIDEEHLKLLSLGYMISAAVSALFSFFGLLYILMGTVFTTIAYTTTDAAKKAGNAPPPEIGWIFGIIGFIMFTFMITIAYLKFRAARCIKRRKSLTFCLIIAGLSCISIPYGTVLGVLTFIVLGRTTVKSLFHSPAA